METTLFDLPLDLREIIYRRSRFLETRRRIAELLGPGGWRPLWNRKSAIIEIVLTVSPTKRMIVRPGAAVDSVEVVDEGSVHVVLNANEETGKVTLLLGTQRRDTAHVYQNCKIANCLCCKRGHSIWLSTQWWRHDSETNMPVLMQSPVFEYVM